MPAIVNISGHTAGDTWMGLSGNFLLNGSPLDLTDASVLMQIRKSSDWPSYANQWSTASGSIIISNATGGQIYVSSGILNVEPYNYYYDIQITLGNGQVVTPIAGVFPVSGNITK